MDAMRVATPVAAVLLAHWPGSVLGQSPETQTTRWVAIAGGAVAVGAGVFALAESSALDELRLPNSEKYDLTQISWPELRDRRRAVHVAWAGAAAAGILATAAGVLVWRAQASGSAPSVAMAPLGDGAVLLLGLAR